jgi:hypothetical protein
MEFIMTCGEWYHLPGASSQIIERTNKLYSDILAQIHNRTTVEDETVAGTSVAAFLKSFSENAEVEQKLNHIVEEGSHMRKEEQQNELIAVFKEIEPSHINENEYMERSRKGIEYVKSVLVDNISDEQVAETISPKIGQILSSAFKPSENIF